MAATSVKYSKRRTVKMTERRAFVTTRTLFALCTTALLRWLRSTHSSGKAVKILSGSKTSLAKKGLFFKRKI